MMPQGAKDSRSHACMEERLSLAPASHEEEARRADSEWAGISKKSQGASSVVRGHSHPPPPEEGAPKGRLPNGGFGKRREAIPSPRPQRKEPCKGRLPNGGFGKRREAIPSPRPQRKEPCKGRLPNGGFGKRREAIPSPPPPEEGALQRATSKWGLHQAERGHPHPNVHFYRSWKNY